MAVEIANIVGSGNLHTELKLEALESDLSTAYLEHDPSNYHGLYVRLVEDGPLITVYRSGKYIVTGATSFKQLHETSDRFLDNLAELGILDESPTTVLAAQNVVCTDELANEVDLTALSIGLGSACHRTSHIRREFPALKQYSWSYPLDKNIERCHGRSNDSPYRGTSRYRLSIGRSFLGVRNTVVLRNR